MPNDNMYVIPLAQLKASQAQQAGSKAASLVKLYAAHAHVPESFLLTDEARRAFFAFNQLGPIFEAELSRLQVEELHSIDYASRVLQEAITSGRFPADMETEILQQYAHTNAPHACVRSSAYAPEGLPDAWIAELRTELNATDATVLDAIKTCWASSFSARSLYLAASHHLDVLRVEHALIVQRMVPALVSGLIYTKHPVHRDPNMMVIEAGFGLGDAIEHGHVLPDTYTVTKKPLKIIEKHIVAQASQQVIGPTGTTVEALEPVEKQKLSDDEIITLSKLAMAMEKKFESPQCLEWAWDDELYLLQSRAITIG